MTLLKDTDTESTKNVQYCTTVLYGYIGNAIPAVRNTKAEVELACSSSTMSERHDTALYDIED
jgi:hypothetical protein